MFEGFEEGLKGAIVGVIVGLLVSGILKVVPSPYRELFEPVNLIQGIAVLESLEHWGTGYTAGELGDWFGDYVEDRATGRPFWFRIYSRRFSCFD